MAAVLAAAAVLAGLGASVGVSAGSTDPSIVVPCMFPQVAAASCSAAAVLASPPPFGHGRAAVLRVLLGCLVGTAVAMVLWDAQKVPMLLQTCAFASQVPLGDRAAGVWVSLLLGLSFGWLDEIAAGQVLAASAGLSLAWASLSWAASRLVCNRARYALALFCACFLPLLVYADVSLAYRMLEAPWAVVAVGVLFLACAAVMGWSLDRKPAARNLR